MEVGGGAGGDGSGGEELAVVVMTLVMVEAAEARVVAMGVKEEVEEATVAEVWKVRSLRVQHPHPLLPTIHIVVLRGGMESWRLRTRLSKIHFACPFAHPSNTLALRVRCRNSHPNILKRGAHLSPHFCRITSTGLLEVEWPPSGDGANAPDALSKRPPRRPRRAYCRCTLAEAWGESGWSSGSTFCRERI